MIMVKQTGLARKLLQSNGYRYIWTNQSVNNQRSFVSAFSQRLKDRFYQTWHSDVVENSKLTLYREYKYNFEHETYLQCLNIRKFRHALAKFRTCSHNLEIEVGRHAGIARTDRTCKPCSLGVEDEAHFMLYCPVLDWLRQKYLLSKFYVSPNINKFHMLMSTKNETIINDVAKYLYHAFKFRKELIDS